eukprot:4239729-Prymnesium_polylepis.1
MVSSLVDHFTSREHGAGCPVPASWRPHVSLCGPYSLSSLAYCAAGIYMMNAFARRPDRLLYAGEHHEAWLWVWQGIISFQCDAVDLGRRSLSHPIDRLSACLVIVFQAGKHYVAMACGLYSVREAVVLNAGLVAGLACYRASCDAVQRGSMRGYLFWHAAWHYTLPAMIWLPGVQTRRKTSRRDAALSPTRRTPSGAPHADRIGCQIAALRTLCVTCVTAARAVARAPSSLWPRVCAREPDRNQNDSLETKRWLAVRSGA